MKKASQISMNSEPVKNAGLKISKLSALSEGRKTLLAPRKGSVQTDKYLERLLDDDENDQDLPVPRLISISESDNGGGTDFYENDMIDPLDFEEEEE